MELLDDLGERQEDPVCGDRHRPRDRLRPENKPGISNLLTIYAGVTGRSMDDLQDAYAGHGYGDLKKDLADVIVDLVTPIRDRTSEWLESPGRLADVLHMVPSERAASRRRRSPPSTTASASSRPAAEAPVEPTSPGHEPSG